jgi:hypothetical protein|tara:strand:+ start:318 stop:761 length:444 start_codon:yes stop_codon:yes gene_type:complete
VINVIYIELPIEKISHLTRPEFVNGQEQKFHDRLSQSISKNGMLDPVFIYHQHSNYKDQLKVIVGNNRMVVAKELGIKIIPAIVVQFNAENSDLKGKVLNSDDEIKQLFHVPHKVEVRRHKEEGWIDQVTPCGFRKDYSLYQGCFKI